MNMPATLYVLNSFSYHASCLDIIIDLSQNCSLVHFDHFTSIIFGHSFLGTSTVEVTMMNLFVLRLFSSFYNRESQHQFVRVTKCSVQEVPLFKWNPPDLKLKY